MKWTVIILICLVLASCEREEEKITKLSAKINGKTINFIGSAYRYNDLRNDKAFGYNYHLFNLETPKIYIEAYDSSFVKKKIFYPEVTAKYGCNDLFGNYKSYNAINGEMSIMKEEKGILFGNFSFTFVNKFDIADTIIATDGYFEMTLQKHDRVWYD